MGTTTAAILRTLRKARRPLSTSEVVGRVGAPRRTVQALLGRLVREGLAVRVRRGGGRGRETLWGAGR
jgi:DNA-binding IclR family transcriptional regulator